MPARHDSIGSELLRRQSTCRAAGRVARYCSFLWLLAHVLFTGFGGTAELAVASERMPAALHLAMVLPESWVQGAKLNASDGAPNDQFGNAVALSDDTAVVGASAALVGENDFQGAVYVFTRSGDVWTEQARLTASEGAAFDQFGVSVALSDDGDTILVGAVQGDGDTANQGVAYVFTRSGGVWSEQAKLTADDGAASDNFGFSVSLSGDTALAGAPQATVGGNFGQGAAYVFTRSGEVWSEQAKLTADDGAPSDSFGHSVSLSGDTALAGARLANVGGNFGQGAAYVFTRSGEVWSEQAKLTADDGATSHNFGHSVSLSGDTALAGAPQATVGGNFGQGAAYVFTRNGEVWSEQAKLTASDGAASDNFGWSAAVSDETAVIGAAFATVGGSTQQGLAYVFTRSGEIWSEQAELAAEDGVAFDSFGSSAAVSDDTALVGAAQGDGDTADQGAAYVFIDFELPPDSATIEGTVQSLGHCSADLQSLADATVEIVGQNNTFFPEVEDDGSYQIVLPDSESPIDITATAADHLPITIEDLSFSGGDTVEQDFDLLLDAPCATVDPTAFSVALDPDQTTTEPLTIGNVDGAAELSWQVATAEPGPAVNHMAAAGPSRTRGVVDCENEPGIIMHDDGTIEAGYAYVAPPGEVIEVVFVDRFTPGAYPASLSAVCLALNSTHDPFSLDFEIVVFDDDGTDGGPGTELGALPASVVIPPFASLEWFSADISSLGISIDSGSVYIGARWTVVGDPFLNVFVTVDESVGHPVGFAGGYWWNDDSGVWTPIQNAPGFGEYRSLFVRAVKDLSGCQDPDTIPWLSLDPIAGSTPAGGTSEVLVHFDTTGLDPGAYRANICIEHNDPVDGLPIAVPVDLAVTIPPDFAVIEGTVQGTGYCGVDPGPIEGAMVLIESQVRSYTVFTENDGSYVTGLDPAEGPVSITASAPGHLPHTVADIELAAGETVTQDFGLILEEPCATVEPEEITAELPEGTSEVLPELTIGNIDGGAALDWAIEIAEPPTATDRDVSSRAVGVVNNRQASPAATRGSAGNALDLASVQGESVPGVRTTRAAGVVVDCTDQPGIIRHDDDTIELAYNGLGELNPVSQAAFADRFTPSAYPASFRAVCVAFVTQGQPSLDFEIVVFDDDGVDGGPGTELGALQVTATDIPLWPVSAPTWASFDVSSLGITVDSGSVYIGARWDVSSNPDLFLSADESPGNPVGFAGGYWWNDDSGQWQRIQDSAVGGEYRSMFVRAVENPGGCFAPGSIPWLSVSPGIGSTPAGENTAVQVTVDAKNLDAGEYEASLCVISNDEVKPLVVVPISLTVTPVEEPELAFDPSSLDFGTVDVGATSPPQFAALSNTGDADATGIMFDLPDGGFDADVAACGTVLPAGQSCQIGVTFTPTQPGPVTAALTASSNEGASAGLDLSGTGVSDDVVTPVALQVDPEALLSDGNRVFEPGELVDVAPAWRNDGLLDTSLTGTATSFEGTDGANYLLPLDHADYGHLEPGAVAGCLDTGICYWMGVNDPPVRPATHWQATFDETLSDGTTHTWSLHIGDSFLDVPRESPFYMAVETLLHHSVTGGCEEAQYCPAGTNTRGQMAVFLLKAAEDAGYSPPACEASEERFDDVPFDNPLCPWIEELAARQVTSGCGGGNYCPGSPVTRAQMAVFLLKAFEGGSYTPPECTGAFTDVTCPSTFAAWIEELSDRGITGGCRSEPPAYCPAAPVTRAQMAVFVSETFGLTLYGP